MAGIPKSGASPILPYNRRESDAASARIERWLELASKAFGNDLSPKGKPGQPKKRSNAYTA